jgi:hypothetical protein
MIGTIITENLGKAIPSIIYTGMAFALSLIQLGIINMYFLNWRQNLYLPSHQYKFGCRKLLNILIETFGNKSPKTLPEYRKYLIKFLHNTVTLFNLSLFIELMGGSLIQHQLFGLERIFN